uniref:Uncharacterized protein n=1 Tax=Cacopsylla melanoneura TaxID=428564 RepID=A0A8D9A7X5_9HEMI
MVSTICLMGVIFITCELVSSTPTQAPHSSSHNSKSSTQVSFSSHNAETLSKHIKTSSKHTNSSEEYKSSSEHTNLSEEFKKFSEHSNSSEEYNVHDHLKYCAKEIAQMTIDNKFLDFWKFLDNITTKEVVDKGRRMELKSDKHLYETVIKKLWEKKIIGIGKDGLKKEIQTEYDDENVLKEEELEEVIGYVIEEIEKETKVQLDKHIDDAIRDLMEPKKKKNKISSLRINETSKKPSNLRSTERTETI